MTTPRPGTKEFERHWHTQHDLGPGDGHYVVVYKGNVEFTKFNSRRSVWHPEDQAALDLLIDRLNKMDNAQ